MAREWTAVFEALCTSSRFRDLPGDSARVFYQLLLLKLDSHGCIAAGVPVVNAKVWPLLRRSDAQTADAIDACASVNLLEIHEDGPRAWLSCPDWDEKAGKYIRNRGKREFPDGIETSKRASIRLCGSGAALRQHQDNGNATDRSGAPLERKNRKNRERDTGGKKKSRATRSPPPASRIDAILPEFPELDVPAFREAWARWFRHRLEIKKPIKPTSEAAAIAECAAMGVERAIEVIVHTIAKGWQGLREPEPSKGQQRNEPRGFSGLREAFANDDAREAAQQPQLPGLGGAA